VICVHSGGGGDTFRDTFGINGSSLENVCTGHSIYRATAEDTLFKKLNINNQATRLLAIIVTQ
jgi:hypothetical protein